jgi:hypothetical protein
MTPETKSEIIIVAIAGAVLAWLWARNHAAGSGTGFEGFPSLGKPPPSPEPTLFDIPAPVPGIDLSYTGSPWALPAPGHYGLDAGSLSSCNCANAGQTGSTFGGAADLVAWLNAQPAILYAGREAANFY